MTTMVMQWDELPCETDDNKMDETKMADNKMETRWMITSSSQVVHTIVNMISLL